MLDVTAADRLCQARGHRFSQSVVLFSVRDGGVARGVAAVASQDIIPVLEAFFASHKHVPRLK